MRAAAYRHYLLAVLLVVLAFNYVDRLALGLLLQDIKTDLALTDTQLGFLTGIAFALFYSVLGIPLARWADRGNRVAIIGITTALWSAAVMLCGLAASFLQLLLIRIVVAVGEAGCQPPAYSLIADYFTRAERPRAVAIYMLGVPLSAVVGLFLAGWLNELYGWRVTFALLGLPGLGLAVLVWLTLREPRRSGYARAIASEMPGRMQPNLAEVCRTLWTSPTFRHLLFCYAVMSFFGAGITKWIAAFFIRSFGLHVGELGSRLALIYGLAGLAGTYWGGEWASRRAAGNEALQLKAMALAFPGIGAVCAGIFLSPNDSLAFVCLGTVVAASTMINGPLFATIQTMVPQPMRAVSIAFIYLFANLIGTGLGPLAAGVLSDVFRPWAGEESLRYALLVLCPGYLWGAWHLWRASRTVAREIQAVPQPL